MTAVILPTVWDDSPSLYQVSDIEESKHHKYQSKK
jgi:hypothetical protein